DLAVHHHCVQPFLPAEVLVDDGLGDARVGGVLLDGCALKAPLGEKPAPDVEQLLLALLASHPLAVVAAGRIGHSSIIAVTPWSGHLALPRASSWCPGSLRAARSAWRTAAARPATGHPRPSRVARPT